MAAKKKRSLDYEVKPFAGAHAPAGVSGEVNRALVEQGLMEPQEGVSTQGAPTEKPARTRTKQPRPRPLTKPTNSTPQPAAPAPSKPRKRSTKTGAASTRSQQATRQTPRTGRAAAKEGRVQRTVRFTPTIDNKLRDLAEARGIDLNAAVCVAIAEDWKQTCR